MLCDNMFHKWNKPESTSYFAEEGDETENKLEVINWYGQEGG